LIVIRKALALLPAGLITLFCFAPVVGVIGSSVTRKGYWEFPPDGFTLRWYELFASRSEWVGSTGISLVTAAIVAALGTTLAFALALILARGVSPTARGFLQALILTPILVPSIGLGLAIYSTYSAVGVPINVATLALAQLILVLPLVTGLVYVGLLGIRPNVERAAANLGAAPWWVFLRVTVPLARATLVAAAIIAFVRSFDDAAVALFVNTGTVVTLPVRMLVVADQVPGPLLAAAGSILLFIALLLAVVVERVIGLGPAFGIPIRQR
jgi:putative spermidine/putrescine transport system permease protein